MLIQDEKCLMGVAKLGAPDRQRAALEGSCLNDFFASPSQIVLSNREPASGKVSKLEVGRGNKP